MTPSALLAALQLGDSALPIGRFVHSHGLESWITAHDGAAPEAFAELVESLICAAIAPLDGAIVARAHGAASTAELERLDELMTAHKLAPPAREASQACGRQLAAIARELAAHDALVDAFAASISDRRTAGHLSVVSGTLSRAVGLSAHDAVLLELRGAAAGLLSAAVRLGALAPKRSQALLHSLHPPIERAAERALSLDLDELHTSAPEMELHLLSHGRADARLFAT